MNKQRLEALSDGIFAIVMTLLVIEIRIPELHTGDTYSTSWLWHGLVDKAPLFGAYFLSFILLTNSWVTHNFMFSIMAKNINRNLINLNALFLAVIALMPFSSHLLGQYPYSRLAVGIYSAHFLLTGLLILVIREYIVRAKQIDNVEFSKIDQVYGQVRIVLSIAIPLIAILLSFWSTYASIMLMVGLLLLLNIPGAIGLITRLIGLEKKLIEKFEGRI